MFTKNLYFVLILMASVVMMAGCGNKSAKVLTEVPEGISEENKEMVPYDTDMTGIVGSMFFIPIDGNIYRYDSMYQGNTDYTRDEMIFSFNEETINETYTHRIYTLKEYPDKTVLSDISQSKADPLHAEEYLIQYAPNGASESDELELAIENGFVIMENGSVTTGKEKWMEFCEKAEAGESAEILLGYVELHFFGHHLRKHTHDLIIKTGGSFRFRRIFYLSYHTLKRPTISLRLPALSLSESMITLISSTTFVVPTFLSTIC